MNYFQRQDYGLPLEVKSFNRITRRPVLPTQLGLMVVHYTGVNQRYATQDTVKVINSINRWKLNEYNYVIDQSGAVFELAGRFQSAHCLNYNDKSYGILFLNGTAEPCTDAQVEAFTWLKNLMRWTQQINPTPYVVPHKLLRATACPGLVNLRVPELQAA